MQLLSHFRADALDLQKLLDAGIFQVVYGLKLKVKGSSAGRSEAFQIIQHVFLDSAAAQFHRRRDLHLRTLDKFSRCGCQSFGQGLDDFGADVGRFLNKFNHVIVGNENDFSVVRSLQ